MGSLLSHVLDPAHLTSHFVLFSVIGILIVTLIVKSLSGYPNQPPGPKPLPFIGNLLDMSKRPKHAFLTIHELSKKYGDVMVLRMFSDNIVVLSSAEVIKEAFHKHSEHFSNRPHTFLVNLGYKSGKGIVWQDKGNWRPVRRFTSTALKDFGVGKNSMEEKIIDEGSALTKVFSDKGGKPFDPAAHIREATANIICSLCFGSRFEYTDKVFRGLVGMIDKNMSTLQLMEPIDFIKVLQWLPLSARLQSLLDNLHAIDKFTQDQIEEHRPSYDADNLRDFIDIYLQKQSEGHEGTEGDLFSELNMSNIIRDLFFAGSETTATTIRWSLLYMISYPHIQERIAKELQEVVGSGIPNTSHKGGLKYLQAFINEVLRVGSVTPAALPHLCEADTDIGGHTIKAGSMVMANVYSIHMDERYWKNPTEFNPDRFLDSKGEVINKKEGFLAFGTGSRACIGETMARTVSLLMLAYLVQNFTFQLADPANPPEIKGSQGLTLAPDPYILKAIPK